MLDLLVSGVLLAQTGSATVDSLGVTHTTYQQTYNNVPVFGGDVKIHRQADGDRFATGHTIPNLEAAANSVIDTTPNLTASAAETAARTLANRPAATSRSTTLYIFNGQLLNKLKPSQNVLVWEVDLYQADPLFHEYYYIDADTGELVYQIHGLNDAINRLIYDCSYADGDCYYDATDVLTGYIYGRSEGQPARGANPNWYITSLTDTDDLYDNLGNIYNYYLTTFARDGANGNGGMGDGTTFPTINTTGLTYIDYYFFSESDYTSCPNAFFDGIGAMHYCEGFVTNDISGHEYAHAVNYFSVLDGSGNPAGLTYTYEIGALNEANSDVFGEALEYYVTGSNDWLLGEDSPIGTMRSMSDPTAYTYTDDSSNSIPYPDRYNSENLYCGEGDSGGVHLNSSVVNKAAYLIAMGGTFNGCTITGLGRAKEEAIFYRAQTTYYTTTTDFNEAYAALLAACADLYSSTDCKEVEKALRATELNQAGYCSGEPAQDPGCAAVETAPTVVSVTSNTADGSYKAGAIIDINVTFSEAVSGNATVTLETGQTDRSCSFTLASETTGSCDYTIQAGDASSDLTVTSIGGTIADSNGDTITSGVPDTNLAANSNLVIDTTKPQIPDKLKIYSSPNKHKRISTINPNSYAKIVKAKSLTPYLVWRAPADVKKYYVKFTDKPTISRVKLTNSKNKQTTNNLRGRVTATDTTYYLHMLLQDYAGNRSKVKTIFKYRAGSSQN